MRLASKIYISYGLLLLMTMGGMFLSNQSAKQAAFQMQRASLAHEQYQEYLSLSSHAFQLFKQFSSEVLLHKIDEPSEYGTIYDELQTNMSHIRHIVGLEIDLVGDEEIGELDRLADIDTLLDNIVDAYLDVLEMKKAGVDNSVLIERLRGISETEEKSSLKRFIKQAVEQEVEELTLTRETVEKQTNLSRTVSFIFTLSAIVLACVSLWIVIGDIGEPLKRLQTGVNKIAAGELAHRIDVVGPQELTNLAEKFNKMAAEIMIRDSDIKKVNKQLEQKVADRTKELKRLLDKLQQDEKNRRRLMADVSHELRTPLTIIQGEADIALRGNEKSSDVYEEALEKTRSAAVHTARIVDDLLFVAKREARETRLKIENLDLVKLLSNFVDNAYNHSGDEAVTINFMTLVDEIEIYADPMRIHQVILILLENAVHYAGGQIIVFAEKTVSGALVRVKDNGPGIPEGEQDLVFERFFRGSNSSERYDGGAGLGLPVAKAIVEAHNGEMTLSSEVGQGTEITFTIPNNGQLEAMS